MQVIFNVDDFGLHPAVCRAVLRLAEAGTVSSTTIMANGPFAEQGSAELRSALGDAAGAGVHLNVLRGRPISRPERIPSLVNPDTGLFFGSWSALFMRYLAGRINPSELELEWDAQIRRVMDMGIRPTHLDGEKHTHAFPAWFRVAGRLAKKHGIGWMRRPVEHGRVLDFSIPGLRIKLLKGFSLFHPSAPGAGTPDMVWGIADQKERLTPEGLGRYLRSHAGAEVVEVVCHPGLPQSGDPGLPEEFGRMRVREQWKAEFDSLLSEQWRDVVHDAGARIVHYGMIRPGESD